MACQSVALAKDGRVQKDSPLTPVYMNIRKQNPMVNNRIEKRDERAFLNAYDFFAPRIFRHAYFRVSSRELAEDIASQVFLNTWKYLLGEDIENIKAFLYRTANNLIIDHYRAKGREPILIDEGLEKVFFYEKDIVREINSQEELREVRGAMDRLEKDFRDVLVMRYVDELSIDEIAEITQKSKNAVYIIISRGIKELKQWMNKK